MQVKLLLERVLSAYSYGKRKFGVDYGASATARVGVGTDSRQSFLCNNSGEKMLATVLTYICEKEIY